MCYVTGVINSSVILFLQKLKNVIFTSLDESVKVTTESQPVFSFETSNAKVKLNAGLSEVRFDGTSHFIRRSSKCNFGAKTCNLLATRLDCSESMLPPCRSNKLQLLTCPSLFPNRTHKTARRTENPSFQNIVPSRNDSKRKQRLKINPNYE